MWRYETDTQSVSMLTVWLCGHNDCRETVRVEREKGGRGGSYDSVCVCELTVRTVRSAINMEHRFPSHTLTQFGV